MDLEIFNLSIRLDWISITLLKFNTFSLFEFSWDDDYSDEPESYGLYIQVLGFEIYNHSDHYYSYIKNYNYGNDE